MSWLCFRSPRLSRRREMRWEHGATEWCTYGQVEQKKSRENVQNASWMCPKCVHICNLSKSWPKRCPSNIQNVSKFLLWVQNAHISIDRLSRLKLSPHVCSSFSITYFCLFSFLASEHPSHRCRVSQKFCDPHASGQAGGRAEGLEGGRDGGGGDTGDIATNPHRARPRESVAPRRSADRRDRWCRALAVTEATNAEQHSSVQGVIILAFLVQGRKLQWSDLALHLQGAQQVRRALGESRNEKGMWHFLILIANATEAAQR